MPTELSKSLSDVGMEGNHCVLSLLISGLQISKLAWKCTLSERTFLFMTEVVERKTSAWQMNL